MATANSTALIFPIKPGLKEALRTANTVHHPHGCRDDSGLLRAERTKSGPAELLPSTMGQTDRRTTRRVISAGWRYNACPSISGVKSDDHSPKLDQL